METAAKPCAAALSARATRRGYIRRIPTPPGWHIGMSGTGVDEEAAAGVHRMPEKSPRVNSRSVMPSSRNCSEMKCMVVPFGSAANIGRSRTTYRPSVTPQRSTNVDSFTGTTSSDPCTDVLSYQRLPGQNKRHEYLVNDRDDLRGPSAALSEDGNRPER